MASIAMGHDTETLLGSPMRIGILSDTHNHIENTRRALQIFRDHEVERLIHCGDITTTQVVELFEGWSVTFVFGNMDRSHADLMMLAKELIGVGSMGYTYTAELGNGVRIAACHGDDLGILNEFIHSGIYQYVFHGHSHSRRDRTFGSTRVICPGALGGREREPRSVCVLDTSTDVATFVEVERE